MSNRNHPPEQKVVIALVSERDYEQLQTIIAWPIRVAGILLASVLFGLLIPACALLLYAIIF